MNSYAASNTAETSSSYHVEHLEVENDDLSQLTMLTALTLQSERKDQSFLSDILLDE